jgi:hypothetical protein
MTGFPRSSDKVISPPSKVSRVKSGARKPSFGLGMSPPVVEYAGTEDKPIQPMPTTRITSVIPPQRFESRKMSTNLFMAIVTYILIVEFLM